MVDSFGGPRKRMLAQIAAGATATAGHTGRSAFTERVMRAMPATPRLSVREILPARFPEREDPVAMARAA